MTVLNYLACILALVALGYEAWLVIKRNRTIVVKGKDDFFTFCLVLLFATLIFRPDVTASLLVSLRNTLILMDIFFTLGIKRGISEQGVVKLGFLIPWNQIREIRIASYQTSKLMVAFSTEKRTYKLIFTAVQLRKLIYEIQKHHPDVMVEESLKISR